MSNMPLERAVQRLEGVRAITQPMSRRTYQRSAGAPAREIEECRAQETPGVTFEAEDRGGESSINRPDRSPKFGGTVPDAHRVDREVTFNPPYAVNMAPAPQPEQVDGYDSVGETTTSTDKPARVERVINNESEDQ